MSRNNQVSTSKWVWVDLEMTGLDENTCSIIQAAMIVTDSQFNELASIDIVVWQPESVLDTMSPYVREMHTKNGLIERVRASQTSLQEAESQLMTILTTHVPYKKGILAGNSIYMDRVFLRRYMPTFETYLHYRQIDVSTMKVLAQEWYGAKGKAPKKPSTHTALEDIQQSIEELKFYHQNFFKLATDT